MKTIFIPTKYNLNKEILQQIKKVKSPLIVTTAQFYDSLKQLNLSPILILGCNTKNIDKIKKKFSSFLYIGSGKFHPLALIKYKKPIFTFNPLTNEFSKISNEEINSYEKRKKGKLIKFYSSSKYGILVSLKPGQFNLNTALKLQKKLQNSFIFFFNTLNPVELENFPDIECWINTACNRIEGKGIINLEDIKL